MLGAGHAGPVIARLAIKAGYPVAIATSGDPEDIALITELVIPGARPRWAADAVADADIVVLAIPLHRFLDLDPALLNGKIVVDAMNYWPASDGVLKPFEEGGSSEIVARRLAGSAVVKALNHIGYHELEDRAPPAGAGPAGRRRRGRRPRGGHRHRGPGQPGRLRPGSFGKSPRGPGAAARRPGVRDRAGAARVRAGRAR